LSSFDQSQSRPDTAEAAASPRPLTRGNSINFSAARSRQKNQAAAKAALSRGAELLSMIRLDIVSFDHLDMQPIRWGVFLINSQSGGGLLYSTLLLQSIRWRLSLLAANQVRVSAQGEITLFTANQVAILLCMCSRLEFLYRPPIRQECAPCLRQAL
jgi:hypothetical protein